MNVCILHIIFFSPFYSYIIFRNWTSFLILLANGGCNRLENVCQCVYVFDCVSEYVRKTSIIYCGKGCKSDLEVDSHICAKRKAFIRNEPSRKFWVQSIFIFLCKPVHIFLFFPFFIWSFSISFVMIFFSSSTHLLFYVHFIQSLSYTFTPVPVSTMYIPVRFIFFYYNLCDIRCFWCFHISLVWW